MRLAKLLALVCWVVAAGVSLSSAFLNGTANAAHGAVLPGVGTAVAVIGGMVLPHWAWDAFRARQFVWGLILWPVAILAIGYTLAQSAGYMSANRGDAVQSRADTIERQYSQTDGGIRLG